MQGGRLIGIGPSSQVYWTVAGGVTSFAVRKGWLKADLRAGEKAGTARVIGPRVGVQCQQAVVLLHVTESFDAMFDEQGTGAICCTPPPVLTAAKETRAGQFLLARDDDVNVTSQSHPPDEFVTQMPVAFRDNLPAMPAVPSAGPLEPRWVRKVTYADVQPWLTAQRSWRTGFIERFRERLRDRAFFFAMDAHLAQHPEWAPILHPPPPPDGTLPAGRQPPGQKPPSQ
jgi:hypothetical protein